MVALQGRDGAGERQVRGAQPVPVLGWLREAGCPFWGRDQGSVVWSPACIYLLQVPSLAWGPLRGFVAT